MRSLNAKAWDDTPFVLRQIEGVGEKSVKALADRGINSFNTLRAALPGRLELILGRWVVVHLTPSRSPSPTLTLHHPAVDTRSNPPFGSKLLKLAKSIPHFAISIESQSEEVVPTGVKVVVRVMVQALKTGEPTTTKKGQQMFWAQVLVSTSDDEYIDFRRLRMEELVKCGNAGKDVSRHQASSHTHAMPRRC